MLRTTLLVWNERQTLAWRYDRQRAWEPRCRRLARGAAENMGRRYRLPPFDLFSWRPASTDPDRLRFCRQVAMAISALRGECGDSA